MGTDKGDLKVYLVINQRKSVRLVMIRTAAAILIITAIGLILYKYSFDFPVVVRTISWVTSFFMLLLCSFPSLFFWTPLL